MADSDEKKTKPGGSSDGRDEELSTFRHFHCFLIVNVYDIGSLQAFGKAPGSTSDKSESSGGTASGAATAEAKEAAATSSDQKAAQEASLTTLKQFFAMGKKLIEIMQFAYYGSASHTDRSTEHVLSSMQNLASLVEKAQKIQEAKSEDEKKNLLQQAGSTYESVLPIIQHILSKDMLYPGLKEMCQKYQKWLDENRDKIDTETLKRYETQHQLIQDACKEYEEEQDDTENLKGPRFERMVGIMKKIKACGPVPKEVIGPLPSGWALDDRTGVPRIVDEEKAMQTCSVM